MELLGVSLQRAVSDPNLGATVLCADHAPRIRLAITQHVRPVLVALTRIEVFEPCCHKAIAFALSTDYVLDRCLAFGILDSVRATSAAADEKEQRYQHKEKVFHLST